MFESKHRQTIVNRLFSVLRDHPTELQRFGSEMGDFVESPLGTGKFHYFLKQAFFCDISQAVETADDLIPFRRIFSPSDQYFPKPAIDEPPFIVSPCICVHRHLFHSKPSSHRRSSSFRNVSELLETMLCVPFSIASELTESGEKTPKIMLASVELLDYSFIKQPSLIPSVQVGRQYLDTFS